MVRIKIRDIKFRAWHKRYKRMYEVLHLHANSVMNGGIWATVKGFHIITQSDIHIKIEPKDIDIMQFTGETDYNNKKIYEKDILKLQTEYYGTKLTHYGIVKFECGTFIVASKTLTDSYITFIELRDEWKVVVLGNIYDNPKLLEENNGN